MPYIDEARRKVLLHGDLPQNGGDNFLITWQIKKFLEGKERSYRNYNSVLGALSGAQQEFYRRVVQPYENEAMRKNGDVY
jgi:hypothetical protein